jgi:hypothetical protein
VGSAAERCAQVLLDAAAPSLWTAGETAAAAANFTTASAALATASAALFDMLARFSSLSAAVRAAAGAHGR